MPVRYPRGLAGTPLLPPSAPRVPGTAHHLGARAGITTITTGYLLPGAGEPPGTGDEGTTMPTIPVGLQYAELLMDGLEQEAARHGARSTARQLGPSLVEVD